MHLLQGKDIGYFKKRNITRIKKRRGKGFISLNELLPILKNEEP